MWREMRGGEELDIFKKKLKQKRKKEKEKRKSKIKEHERNEAIISKFSIYVIISGWPADNIYNKGNISYVNNFIFNYNSLLSNTFESREIQRKFNNFLNLVQNKIILNK